MTTPSFPARQYPKDVAIVPLADKITLFSTTQISQQSAVLVKCVIEQGQPDSVCIELDPKRFAALSRRQSEENLALKQVVRKKQPATLKVPLSLATTRKNSVFNWGSCRIRSS